MNYEKITKTQARKTHTEGEGGLLLALQRPP